MLPPLPKGRVQRGSLYDALRVAILDGTFAAGERLPSSRQAAADYHVSRGLVEEVFTQLTDEGLLERGVGRGTFVAPEVARLPRGAATRTARHAARSPSRRGVTLAANAACREPAAVRPFNAGIADTSLFPWDQWRSLRTRAWRETGRDALTFADPRGLPDLRAAVARYLAQFRGIRCAPSEVVIFNSAQQALNALCLLLLDHGDPAWVEDPCYLGARAALGLAGASISSIPVDESGMQVDVGIARSPRARLVYTTPAHQYPTGVAMSLERRIALLDWARAQRAWIVEDDYDGEFGAGRAATSLHALDAESLVLYVGTLNKSMFVSLRLAFAIVPDDLVEPLANIRTQLDGFTPVCDQKAMSLFMNEGGFSSHLRRMRALYTDKRRLLLDGLAPLALSGWTWPTNPTGIHLMVRHQDGRRVRDVVRRSRLDLAMLSAYRVAGARDDGVFLRYAALDATTLQSAVDRLVHTMTRSGPRRRRPL